MSFKTRIVYIFCFILISVSGYAKQFFVATNGDNNAIGDISHPFLTIQKAQEAVVAGDTVYVRGGIYMMTEEMIAATSSNIWAFVTHLNKSGSAGKRINYWAYPGERPIFNYQNVKPLNLRVHAFQVTGSYIHIKGLEVVGVQVTILTHTQSECFENQGSYNIYEQLSMHDGQAIGFYLTKGSNNLILNCDAYNNRDYTSENKLGGNTDGFGNHPSSDTYVNNIFRGCRAWFNSDDGYDCISAKAATVFENCWAFYNGYSSTFSSLADGNGFKAGGYGSATLSSLPVVIPNNTIKYCLSVKNKSNGFYSNHHLAGSYWYNNTAYLNANNYNMLNRKAPNSNDYLTDVPGFGHVLKNNLGFNARSSEMTQIDYANCDASNNYFNLPVSVSSADFKSLDLALLTLPRQADGSLPNIDFMRLKDDSDLINAGIDIGFPFEGLKPDLGYQEFIQTLPINLFSFIVQRENAFLNLKWTTLSEKNNQYFIVERSKNGIDFDSIGSVSAIGFSQTKHDYSFLDHQPLQGINYYRIKQIDNDGKFTYSFVLVFYFKLDLNSKSAIISPNPANKEISIYIESPQNEPLFLKILDTNGNKCSTQLIHSFDGGIKQDISKLVDGIYLIELYSLSTKEILFKGKFIKAP
jgi:hypothetical protein